MSTDAKIMGIDIAEFKRWEAAGNARLMEYEGEVYLWKRFYDPHTGEPSDAAFTKLPLTQLEEQVANWESQLAAAREFLAKVKSVKSNKSPKINVPME